MKKFIHTVYHLKVHPTYMCRKGTQIAIRHIQVSECMYRGFMPSNDTKIDDVGAPEKTRIKFASIIDELFKSQIALIQHKILF